MPRSPSPPPPYDSAPASRTRPLSATAFCWSGAMDACHSTWLCLGGRGRRFFARCGCRGCGGGAALPPLVPNRPRRSFPFAAVATVAVAVVAVAAVAAVAAAPNAPDVPPFAGAPDAPGAPDAADACLALTVAFAFQRAAARFTVTVVYTPFSIRSTRCSLRLSFRLPADSRMRSSSFGPSSPPR